MAVKSVALEQIAQIDFDSLTGWNSLPSQDQKIVKMENRELAENIRRVGESKIQIGKSLSAIRDILEPQRIWLRYLKTLQWPRATAYRFINTFLYAKQNLHAPVLQVAIMRGIDNLNPRTIKVLPPPKTDDIGKINAYLDKVQKLDRVRSTIHAAEDEMAEVFKREVFNFIRSRWSRLPATMSKKQKHAWLQDVRGMTLTLEGVASTLTIEAQAIPSTYIRPRGRPRRSVQLERAS